MKNKLKKMYKKIKSFWKDESGFTAVEMILILVVLIAIVLIFKNQLISLVNTIFEKIVRESSGI